MKGKIFLSLFFSLILVVSLAGCGRSNNTSSQIQGNNATDSKAIRIGYQKYGTLSILKAQGTLDERLSAAGYTIQWTEFPGGPQLLEALNAGKIDLGHTGEAPPIFAQAAGAPLVYLAHEPASPQSEGILIPEHSTITRVSDLKGKKVALNKGSNVHYLLVKQLEKAGLKYSDIQPVFLPPADARAAFERESVDAWVIWDPYFAAAQTATHARILADGKDTVSNHEFYLASRTFVQNRKDVTKIILDEVKKTDEWTKGNQRQTAELLSPQLGIDVPSLELAAKRREYGVQEINDQVITEQQKIADTFLQLGLIPKEIQVKEALQ